ncbi:MAG TPA: ferredoxin family protein [Methanobacteriales archaeon]|jgi:MinD superfamily P-loop ATPase containing an inserted ferredoxin domain|nr:ferredoxin family protein [Methanobacteriaceae archaeon]MBC7096105.1 ferredoxin family protein [Methanobacteriales archaeon]HIH62058.1 ferredoxin family protein [Methanobacteriales archaeon]
MKIIIEYEKCTGCGKCKEACPKGGKIWTIDRKRKIAIPSNLEYCHLCIICASKCPEEAIRIIRDDNYEKSPEIEENP